VWCKSCNHLAEPDVATQFAQHGAGVPVPDWARLLRCTERGLRDAVVVTGGERRRQKVREGATGSLAIVAPDHGPSHPCGVIPRIAIANDAPRGATSSRRLYPPRDLARG
jgi:hypothetical protein